MKILQINAVYGSKSTGVIVKDIDDLLRKEGHESYVAYRDCYGEVNQGIRVGNVLSWKYHALYTRLTGKQGYASGLDTIHFLKKIDKLDVEVIHLHNIHSNFIHFPRLLRYAQKKQIPILMTLHDSWFFTGKCYHFLDCGCEKWKSICGNCPKRFSDIPSILGDNSQKVYVDRKKLYKENDLYVVGCSKWIAACAAESPLFAEVKVSQIYNGIDTEVFSEQAGDFREQLQLKDRFVVVTMANKWFHEKNQPIRKALLKMLDSEDRVLVVGCSQEQMNHPQEDQKLMHLGYITDRSELAKIYATGDVFLNLTFVDTLPTVNMEAAACGTPVITYDAGGSGELVRHGETGFIIEPLNIAQLAEAIQKVKLGKINRSVCVKWAKEHFDKNENYRKYIDLYEQIIANKS